MKESEKRKESESKKKNMKVNNKKREATKKDQEVNEEKRGETKRKEIFYTKNSEIKSLFILTSLCLYFFTKRHF